MRNINHNKTMKEMEKRAIKKWLMPVIGLIAFGAFLVMCSEPLPGEVISLARFATPKVIAILTLAGCAWAVNKIDKAE